MTQDIVYLVFVFAVGACAGSFLNVVAWRLPRGESVVTPPSRCPRCGTRLGWRDNIPIFGWLLLRGRCRYCNNSVSPRYPIVEAFTASLFVAVYATFFIAHVGPCQWPREMSFEQDWPYFMLVMFLLCGLLVSSMIDFEQYLIPIEISWMTAALGVGVHAAIARPSTPGSLSASPPVAAATAGLLIGLTASIILLRMKFLPQSFSDGGPLLEHEKKELTARQDPPPFKEFASAEIRAEMRKEMLFLLPPLIVGGVSLLLWWRIPAVSDLWQSALRETWLSGALGSIWGALVGAGLIWFIRIGGSYLFGREAMGLGDAHLMLGIGAAIGAEGATLVFFIAPFAGLLFAVWKWLSGRGREVAYGPYLAVATLAVVIWSCRLEARFGLPMSNMINTLMQPNAPQP